jgi:hypothetical protein
MRNIRLDRLQQVRHPAGHRTSASVEAARRLATRPGIPKRFQFGGIRFIRLDPRRTLAVLFPLPPGARQPACGTAPATAHRSSAGAASASASRRGACFGKVNGNAQLARRNRKPAHVVGVLVGNKIASSVAGSSPARRMRRKSSRQLSPASTSIRVRPPVTTVALPLEPEASTVKRTILLSIARNASKWTPAALTALATRTRSTYDPENKSQFPQYCRILPELGPPGGGALSGRARDLLAGLGPRARRITERCASPAIRRRRTGWRGRCLAGRWASRRPGRGAGDAGQH